MVARVRLRVARFVDLTEFSCQTEQHGRMISVTSLTRLGLARLSSLVSSRIPKGMKAQ